MDNTAVQRIRELVDKNDKIGIAVGKDANIDDMAAALSLYITFNTTKKVVIACPEPVTVELSSLVGINKVKTVFESNDGDLVVSFPYYEGEIEKVSYTIDDGFLNIVVKATEQGLTFNEKDVQFKRSGGIPTLLFIVGTPRLSDLGKLFNPDDLKNTKIVNIDIKPENQGFGDVVLVAPQNSSVSEHVADLLLDMNVDFSVDVAQNLLQGISFATTNFQSQKTSYLAFEIASVLLRKGAVRVASRPAQTSQAIPMSTRQQPQPRPAGITPQPPLPPAGGPKPQPISMPQPQTRIQPQSIPPVPQPQPPSAYPSFMPAQEDQEEDQPDQTERPQQPQKPPSDWLTPKVYKGSTTV